jgi:Phospholipase_D-nuclease N-terminal
MGLKGIVISIVVFTHLAFSITHLYDLKAKSQRSHKWKWALIILFLPFAGAFLYDRTKQRRRQPQW